MASPTRTTSSAALFRLNPYNPQDPFVRVKSKPLVEIPCTEEDKQRLDFPEVPTVKDKGNHLFNKVITEIENAFLQPGFLKKAKELTPVALIDRIDPALYLDGIVNSELATTEATLTADSVIDEEVTKTLKNVINRIQTLGEILVPIQSRLLEADVAAKKFIATNNKTTKKVNSLLSVIGELVEKSMTSPVTAQKSISLKSFIRVLGNVKDTKIQTILTTILGHSEVNSKLKVLADDKLLDQPFPKLLNAIQSKITVQLLKKIISKLRWEFLSDEQAHVVYKQESQDATNKNSIAGTKMDKAQILKAYCRENACNWEEIYVNENEIIIPEQKKDRNFIDDREIFWKNLVYQIFSCKLGSEPNKPSNQLGKKETDLLVLEMLKEYQEKTAQGEALDPSSLIPDFNLELIWRYLARASIGRWSCVEEYVKAKFPKLFFKNSTYLSRPPSSGEQNPSKGAGLKPNRKVKFCPKKGSVKISRNYFTFIGESRGADPTSSKNDTYVSKDNPYGHKPYTVGEALARWVLEVKIQPLDESNPLSFQEKTIIRIKDVEILNNAHAKAILEAIYSARDIKKG